MSDMTDAELLELAKKRGLYTPPSGGLESMSDEDLQKLANQRGLYDDLPPEVPNPGLQSSGGEEEGRKARRPAGDIMRNGLLFGGGTIGAALGAPLGPLGMGVGSMLGVGGGEALSQNITDLENMFRGKPPQDLGMGDRFKNIGKEMLLEGLVTGGLTAGGEALKAGSKWSARKLTGVTAKSIEAARAARRQGIDLSITDVSDYPVVQGFSNIIGRFPYVGTPFKRAKLGQLGQVEESFDRMAEQLGPSVTIAQSGIDLTNTAVRKFRAFKDVANEKYEAFRVLAEATDARIPTQPIKDAAATYVANAEKRALTSADGKTLPGGPQDNSPALAYARRLAGGGENTGLADEINMHQFDGLMEELDTIIAQSKKDGFSVTHLMSIKKASEDAARKMKGDPAVLDALKEADEYYATMAKIFETPTAQKFGRVDRNIFKIGYERPGSINDDELMRFVFNTKSPQAIRDLTAIIGKKEMSKAAGVYIREAFESAASPVKDGKAFKAEDFMKALGLDSPRSSRYESVKAAIESSGVTMRDIEDFARAAERAVGRNMPDVSTFVARRGMLEGAKGALKAGVPGLGTAIVGTAAGGTTVGLMSGLGAIFAILMARQGSKLLSNPASLRLITSAMNPQLPNAQRNAAIVRALRLIPKDEEGGEG